ncbi:hypothetical protein BpHYR1_026399 [Brachionus plicatilis]|uniref:Uncharacterized protein n=1 Tax=Brachionus plicatilis TaxID=10195 RepID=A0A3M7R4N8_BRAPC|nr:hypothetical protein BpHYR1_026399 [Brachionus plicatilis]
MHAFNPLFFPDTLRLKMLQLMSKFWYKCRIKYIPFYQFK